MPRLVLIDTLPHFGSGVLRWEVKQLFISTQAKTEVNNKQTTNLERNYTMITSLQCWRVVAALTTLSIGARSLNSINLELETPGTTPLSALGTPNLDKYNGTYNLEVWESKENGDCRYTLHFDFNVNEDSSPVGDPEFQGTCAPTDSTGNAPDGLPWHAHRRNWIKFPQYVYDTTGFDHVSLEWVPCGRAPAGFRKARFDLNFYTVSPEYRTYMICDEFKTPRVCQYNQTSHIGRSQFTLPRLAMDVSRQR